MALTDIQAMIGHHTATTDQKTASPRPRTEPGSRSARNWGQQGQAALPAPTRLMTVFRGLDEDVTCYVCHNEERERVRSFVFEALLRLASRRDVDAIVLNAHSNGTVIALDVIHNLPPPAAAKIKAFITTGSPLRKYVDLFHWGQQIKILDPIKPWFNFWDYYDPVADPLEPPIHPSPGTEVTRLLHRMTPNYLASLILIAVAYLLASL